MKKVRVKVIVMMELTIKKKFKKTRMITSTIHNRVKLLIRNLKDKMKTLIFHNKIYLNSSDRGKYRLMPILRTMK